MDLMNAASAAAAVYSFRVADKMVAARKAAKGQLPAAVTSQSALPAAAGAPALAAPAAAAVHGDFGADPVQRAAYLAAMARNLP
jgi:hypothetical protein